jgi:transposase
MAKRKRRSFTKEFKAQAVRIVPESGKPVGTMARELDLTETALRSWVRQTEIDAGRVTSGALTTEEREELGRLRHENRTLRMERDTRSDERRGADSVAVGHAYPAFFTNWTFGRDTHRLRPGDS